MVIEGSHRLLRKNAHKHSILFQEWHYIITKPFINEAFGQYFSNVYLDYYLLYGQFDKQPYEWLYRLNNHL